MTTDKPKNLSESTPRETGLQRQLDGLHSQVTNLFKAWEAAQNLELSPKVQSVEEQPDERLELPEQCQEEFVQSDPRDCWGQNWSRRNRCPNVLRKTESRSKIQKPRK